MLAFLLFHSFLVDLIDFKAFLAIIKFSWSTLFKVLTDGVNLLMVKIESTNPLTIFFYKLSSFDAQTWSKRENSSLRGKYLNCMVFSLKNGIFIDFLPNFKGIWSFRKMIDGNSLLACLYAILLEVSHFILSPTHTFD